MSYEFSISALLDIIHSSSKAYVEEINRHHREVHRGRLSIGLKLHCLDGGKYFYPIVEELGGARKILEINAYKRDTEEAICFVLPPVGNVASAIYLLKALEEAAGVKIFGNRMIQIQVCSPGRLTEVRSAFLAIGFYLNSKTLRRFALSDLATTFSKFDTKNSLERGSRIALYDAGYGMFDRDFKWWGAGAGGAPLIANQLPFESDRTDILTATTEEDIENINLLATLLCHEQVGGYWRKLGRRFKHEFGVILDEHMLMGVLDAPWIRTTDDVEDGDERFSFALQELERYIFEDVMRSNRLGKYAFKEPEGPCGILWQIKQLIENYRDEHAELAAEATA